MKPGSFASAFSFAAVVLLAACGGGGSAGPVDTATAEDGCQLICDHEAECGSTNATCLEDCVDEVVGVIREDAFEDITECLAALACTASDDDCLTACSPTSTHQRFEDRCREEVAACGEGAGDPDACEVTPVAGSDDSAQFCLLATPIIEDLIACFDEATCDAKGECLGAVLDAAGF